MSKKGKNKPPANQRSVAKIQSQIVEQQFIGPMPHPQILDGYDRIIPGAAERILSMAERDQRHQMEIERSAQQLVAREVRRGQIYGLIVSISAFATAIVSLFLGFEKAAMVIGGTTVVGLVTVFITGRSKDTDKKEPESDTDL